MSPRASTAALVLAAAVIAAAVTAPAQRRPARAVSSAPPLAVTASPVTPAHAVRRVSASARHTARVAATRQRSAARAVAAEFLAAFLAYERGAHGRAIVRALTRTAAPLLAQALRATPPRRPPGRAWPSRARARDITVIGPPENRAKALATLQRDGRREVLELRMRRGAGRWRVAGLG
jgi:hypothetical protein